MQSIKTYFADLSQRLGLADELIVLSPKRRAAKQPMQLGEVQDQTEHYMDLSSGAEEGKGIFTGVWGMGAIYMFLIMSPVIFQDWEGALYVFTAAAIMFGITSVVFLLEVFWPSSSPIRFNRRTREVYFQDKDKLYHAPWDEAVAWMQENRTVTQYTGAMTETPLQLLLQRYENPKEIIALQLNMPIGRTAETQGMLWEYLRCYMEEGPWFDENGQPLAGSNREEVLEDYRRQQKKATLDLEHYRKLVQDGIFTPSRARVRILGAAFFYPCLFIRDITVKYARQRAAGNQWHPLVKERCRPDGPTTRLYDLEVAEGLHEGAEMSAAEQASATR
ncbi:DUF6708 domain-containing protein [Billgrantia aerodenitrificans]|uniref:DUF6708 domain-containing protein n=1 Tax=Billgrantia aerodenitrificans TaxID=2733483 RepID=A0ABS9AYC7_9GAMM|nr:DUF6708 domain-containing protein [Halomonas aerodenitrificans]MCE8026921.1 hypothetical protein [Halomonas aerodenitrificans]